MYLPMPADSSTYNVYRVNKWLRIPSKMEKVGILEHGVEILLWMDTINLPNATAEKPNPQKLKVYRRYGISNHGKLAVGNVATGTIDDFETELSLISRGR